MKLKLRIFHNLKMRKLRSQKNTPIEDTEVEKDQKKRKANTEIANPTKKSKKIDSRFDPDTFNESNKYKDICDSSDSESEYEKESVSDEEIDLENTDNEEEEDVSSWKDNLTKEELPELEAKFESVIGGIKDKSPSIVKILKSNLISAEKERAIVLYNIMQNADPNSYEYYYIYEELNRIINTAPKDHSEDLENKLKDLQEAIHEKFPTLERILSANLVKRDKMQAFNLFESLKKTVYNSNEYFDLSYKINSILDRQLTSEEEVKKAELQEEELGKAVFNYNDDLKKKIFDLDADPEVKKRLLDMYYKMINKGSEDSESSKIKEKLIWSLKLPYRKQKPSIIKDGNIGEYLKNVYKNLDEELYGMKKAKERVIEILNNRIYNPSSRSIIALLGKPGVGKTRFAKVFAKAAGYGFDKISLGGSVDSTIFKGSESVWNGSAPSMILQILSRHEFSEVAILIDELDKLPDNEKGLAVQHSLLHVLDPSQNKEFNDAFLSDFDHDISNTLFFATMNDLRGLDPTLLDRLDIIEIPSYTKSEMVEIIKLHTLPGALKDKGIDKDSVTITDEACQLLLNNLGDAINDSGMRPVEKVINEIISKLNLLRSLNNQDVIPLSFKLDDFKGFPYVINEKCIAALNDTPKKKKEDLFYII